MSEGASQRPGGGSISRRRFIQGSAVVTGAALAGPAGLAWPSGAVAAAPVRKVRGIPLQHGGLGYPGLDHKAVLGAELQYFRMSPKDIPNRLDLCQEARYSVIQTYVPWNVHEYFQGKFDFTGRYTPILPNTHVDEYQIEDPVSETEAAGVVGRGGILCNSNLEAYIRECAARGFKMILRPGPFISDEWRNGGMPDWMLAEGFPSIYEYGPDGTVFSPGTPLSPPGTIVTGGAPEYYFPSPSYASEEYMSRTKTWLTAFVRFLIEGDWFQDKGGPVVGLQVDDESSFFYHFAPFEVDYNPAMLERWRVWSGGIAPPRGWPDASGGIASLKVPFRWHRFKAEQQANYLGELADYLEAAGAKVPINHELEQDMVPPADMADDAGQIILNGEFYQGSDASVIPSNEVIAQAIRAASRQLRPTFATEMDNGDPLLYALLIGEGIYGGLQFTYTEGVSDGDLGVLQGVARAYDAAGPILGKARRRADVAVVWDPRQTYAPFGAERWGFRTDVRSVIEKHVPALLTLLVRAGYAFDFLDPAAAEPEDLERYPTIFLAASDICPRAFQSHLARYVHRGGRLVCWPAPPNLDETLEPCTTLADACFPERVAGSDSTDGIEIELEGVKVPVWRGVTTFSLSRGTKRIATLDGRACGYERRHGRGEAVLLGSWLAADSVCGRDGDILEEQTLTPDQSLPLTLAQLATKHLSAAAAKLIPNELPGGTAQSVQVWFYANQRQEGEVITSGSISYFDGENVIGVVELNCDPTEPALQTLPYHPVLPSHIAAVRRLAQVVPQVTATDTRLQARILDGPGGTATVSLCNRFFVEVRGALETKVGKRLVRLPRRGTFALPPTTGLLLPLEYPVGRGHVIRQATAQLLEVSDEGTTLTLDLLAPMTGELVLELRHAPQTVTVDGKRVTPEHVAGPRHTIAISLPSGQPRVAVTFAG